VEKVGKWEGSIAEDAFDQLCETIVKEGFFSFNTTYGSASQAGVDGQHSRTTVRWFDIDAGVTKETGVELYGESYAPLMTLNDAIDSFMSRVMWYSDAEQQVMRKKKRKIEREEEKQHGFFLFSLFVFATKAITIAVVVVGCLFFLICIVALIVGVRRRRQRQQQQQAQYQQLDTNLDFRLSYKDED
jgi:hypothetical protein